MGDGECHSIAIRDSTQSIIKQGAWTRAEDDLLAELIHFFINLTQRMLSNVIRLLSSFHDITMRVVVSLGISYGYDKRRRLLLALEVDVEYLLASRRKSAKLLGATRW